MSGYRHINTLIVFGFITTLILPITLSAQTYSQEWRQRNNELNSKISALDSNKVLELPIPILFGITQANLTRNFGDPRSSTRAHEGLDIMAHKGSIIVSPTKAVVIRVGYGDSAGYYVYTANPGGETFAYMHLDQASHLKEGDVLEKGDLIGFVGNTGNAINAGHHLHFEVRTDAGATDPFPRLTTVFPAAEKIQYLTKILSTAPNQAELAGKVVALHRAELVSLQSANIQLPMILASAIGTPASVVATTGTALAITRTLRQGMKGEDVKLLQTALGITADGAFGPKTRAAVIAFQASKGLVADGIFGAKSRGALAGTTATNLPAGCTATTAYSPLTGVKCR